SEKERGNCTEDEKVMQASLLGIMSLVFGLRTTSCFSPVTLEKLNCEELSATAGVLEPGLFVLSSWGNSTFSDSWNVWNVLIFLPLSSYPSTATDDLARRPQILISSISTAWSTYTLPNSRVHLRTYLIQRR